MRTCPTLLPSSRKPRTLVLSSSLHSLSPLDLSRFTPPLLVVVRLGPLKVLVELFLPMLADLVSVNGTGRMSRRVSPIPLHITMLV